MGPCAIHVFVCTGGGTRLQQGSLTVHASLKEAVAEAGLASRVRVNHGACLEQCGHDAPRQRRGFAVSG